MHSLRHLGAKFPYRWMTARRWVSLESILLEVGLLTRWQVSNFCTYHMPRSHITLPLNMLPI
jgi:hypothetical protein